MLSYFLHINTRIRVQISKLDYLGWIMQPWQFKLAHPLLLEDMRSWEFSTLHVRPLCTGFTRWFAGNVYSNVRDGDVNTATCIPQSIPMGNTVSPHNHRQWNDGTKVEDTFHYYRNINNLLATVLTAHIAHLAETLEKAITLQIRIHMLAHRCIYSVLDTMVLIHISSNISLLRRASIKAKLA